MAQRFTYFKAEWLHLPTYKAWISTHPSISTSAKCKICLVSVDIRYMGKSALDSQEKSNKHQNDIIAFKSPNPIQS